MSWQGKAEETGQVHEITPNSKPQGFGSKLKAHLRRFWWLHLIIFIACTLIIVLCLLYAAFPRIAQDNVNKSTLAIETLILSAPTATSFHLLQNATLNNPSDYHPNFDAFNASVSLHDRPPYGLIAIPKIHATAHATSIVDQDVKITDKAAFEEYCAKVLTEEEIQLDVKGRTGLHEMSFPDTTVDYHKTVTLKALNKLNGFNVTDFTIELTPEPDGTNMIGTVYIPNPSVMTISMGNVTFTNYLRTTPPLTTPLGITTLTNLTLVPGNNTLPMRSMINQTLVLSTLATTHKDGILPVDIVGNSSVYEGQHLTYFEKALGEVVQHVDLDVGAKLKGLGVDASQLAALAGGSPP